MCTDFVITNDHKFGLRHNEKLDFTSHPVIPLRLPPPLMMSHPVTLRPGMRNIVSRPFSLLAVWKVVPSATLFHPYFSCFGELFTLKQSCYRLLTAWSGLHFGNAGNNFFCLSDLVLSTDIRREIKEKKYNIIWYNNNNIMYWFLLEDVYILFSITEQLRFFGSNLVHSTYQAFRKIKESLLACSPLSPATSRHLPVLDVHHIHQISSPVSLQACRLALLASSPLWFNRQQVGHTGLLFTGGFLGKPPEKNVTEMAAALAAVVVVVLTPCGACTCTCVHNGLLPALCMMSSGLLDTRAPPDDGNVFHLWTGSLFGAPDVHM